MARTSANKDDLSSRNSAQWRPRKPSAKKNEMNHQSQDDEIAKLKKKLEAAKSKKRHNNGCSDIESEEELAVARPVHNSSYCTKGRYDHPLKPKAALPGIMHSASKPPPVIEPRCSSTSTSISSSQQISFTRSHSLSALFDDDDEALSYSHSRRNTLPSEEDDRDQDSDISAPQTHASRSPSPDLHLPMQRKRKHLSCDHSMDEPFSVKKQRKAIDTSNLPTGKRAKPAKRDFSPAIQGTIQLAIDYYEVLLMTRNAYPDADEKEKFATESWEYAMLKLAEDDQSEMDTSIRKKIQDYGSHLRGELKNRISPIIKQHFKFNASATDKAKSANIDLAAGLLDNDADATTTWHKKGILPYEGKAMVDAIRAAVFDHGRDSPAIRFEGFDPVPLPFMALIVTLAEHLIVQWIKDGTNAKDWDAILPDITFKIRQKLFKRLREETGVSAAVSLAQYTEDEKSALRAALLARQDDSDEEDRVEQVEDV
ncbi:hypothetical protein DL96DRAFT_1677552 [Flagelloscypha sp. PMI_526]|nr:hypothetical protein DL96DRAFT_1677552 [Flagelloscypha sp. PMI_526]